MERRERVLAEEKLKKDVEDIPSGNFTVGELDILLRILRPNPSEKEISEAQLEAIIDKVGKLLENNA